MRYEEEEEKSIIGETKKMKRKKNKTLNVLNMIEDEF